MKAILLNLGALSAGASAAGAVFGAIMYGSPLLHSDPPPWRGITESDAAMMKIEATSLARDNATKALIVKGQILGAWGRLCDGLRTHNPRLGDLQEQYSDLQLSYMTLTGLTYPLGPCQ